MAVTGLQICFFKKPGKEKSWREALQDLKKG
jgi:hypothetical protein